MMAADTTEPSYWLNWRFLVSAIGVLVSMIFAAFLIRKYEGAKKLDDERREHGQVSAGVIYKDELWKTCLKCIHPVFLLIFRLLAFIVLLALISANTIIDGAGIFLYYTQWTFTLTTVYFGLATVYSIKGLTHDGDGARRFKIASPNIDAEQGTYVPKSEGGQNTPLLKTLSNDGGRKVHFHHIADSMDYVLQIIFQVTTGAVVLTDAVFWLIIYPTMSKTDDDKLSFFNLCMHSVNVLVFGDAILNCMRFPMFRIAYFILYTGIFVICEWIIHACVFLEWPYPFMDLSPPSAPIWYAAVDIMHFPSYGCIALVLKFKHLWLSRSFPDQYQGMR